ncbi:hypothetical protein DLP3_030 [Stenotrophomonas phage vB_SmaS_DLP_3]|nr:hypothetical protein DLP3_030 [Stenotrophomonas phage vB_SmaS_DLP_3]
MPTPEIEQEAAVASHTGAGASAMTTMEKLVTGLLGLLSTSFLIILAVAIRRKNKEQGTEDFVWVMSNRTIERLNKEVEALQKENTLIRGQKNQFESAAAQAQARADIASQAAEVARAAAVANVEEMNRLRRNWDKLLAYTHVLRMEMVKNNVQIPPEPEFE